MNQLVPAAVRHVEQASVRCPGAGAGARGHEEAGIDAAWWRWVRPLGGVALLGAVVATLGTGPFVDGLRATDGRSLLVGAALALGTTACAAWRWQLVARRLGMAISLPDAVASCYRSQFLNVVLPGGVLGDVGRGVDQGRKGDDVGRGLRTVAWERATGQVVLAVTTVVVLLLARPFPLPSVTVPTWLVAVVATGCTGLAVAWTRGRWGGGPLGRTAVGDARALLTPTASVPLTIASLAVLLGHVATFVVAARTVGVGVPVLGLLPLALVVLLVAGVPLNLAGWGPREGAAAWVFGAVGLGATQGLAVAVAYGAIVFVGTLPGGVLLLAGWSRRHLLLSADAGTVAGDG